MARLFFDAFTQFGHRKGLVAQQRWTLKELVEEMRFCSISGALVSHTMCVNYDAMWENRRLCELLKPYDFLYPLWNVHPHWTCEIPKPDDLIKQMQQHNVRAVTIHPKTNQWSVVSRTSNPLFEALEQSRIPVLLNLLDEGDIDQVETLLTRYPQLPIILHKVWWNRQRHVIPLLLAYKNLHVTFDHFQINNGLEWLVKHGCQEQLLYGSNGPTMSMGAHRFYVDYAEIPDSAKDQIAGGNLSRLLGGLRPARVMTNPNEDPIMATARQGKPIQELVIDFHAHILDEGLQGCGGSYTTWDGGPDGTVHQNRRLGVKRMGLMSWNGTVGGEADDGNRCTRAALDAHPDFFWGLGTFDPVHDSSEAMFEKMKQLYADPRFIGLKPYPAYGLPYDDSRYDVWWKFGNERGLYCLLHPVKWFQPAEFDSIASRFPNLTVVAAHTGGGWSNAETAVKMAQKHPNFFAEITLTPVHGGIIEYLVQGAGADRVLYGSDLPMRDPRPQLGWVVYSRLSYEDKKKVLGLNAQALLSRIEANARQHAQKS